MRVPYPKSAREIAIKESVLPNEESETPAAARAARPMVLSDKIVEYLYSYDFGKGHVLEIIMQVLTQGKVRVEFADRFERLEVADPEDKISRTQVTAMFDDFIEEVTRGGEESEGGGTTQRISMAPKKPATPVAPTAPQRPAAPAFAPAAPRSPSTPPGFPQAPRPNGAVASPGPMTARPGVPPSTQPLNRTQVVQPLRPAGAPAPAEGSEAPGFMGKIKKLFGS